MITIDITIWNITEDYREMHDMGDEDLVVTFPARMEVCHRCEGTGYHLRPGIEGHAYSMEEFNDIYHEEEDRQEYFKRGGIYDVVCEDCKGNNVVKVLDSAAITDPEKIMWLKAYHQQIEWEQEWAAERAAELRMGA